jgi:Spy/CpxP family protein refolding chaperone
MPSRYFFIIATTAILIPPTLPFVVNYVRSSWANESPTYSFFEEGNIVQLPQKSSSLIVSETKNTSHKINRLKSLLEELNLNPIQKQKIAQIRRQYQGKIIEEKENLQSAQDNLANMIAGDDSAAAIRTQHQKIVSLQEELGKLHFESMLAIREILTPQQRQKFTQVFQVNQ